MSDESDDAVTDRYHADPHAEYHRQAAAHFRGTTQPQPGRGPASGYQGTPANRMTRPAWPAQQPPVAQANPRTDPFIGPQPGRGSASGRHSTPLIPSPPPAASGYGAPSATSADTALQWLAAPEHLKLVVGGVGGFVALILLLTGSPEAKIAGLILVVAVWAVCFRQGYHEKAGLQAQTPIPADQATRVAVDVANTLHGPLSSIQFTGSSAARADFVVSGSMWRPLHFHFSSVQDPSGWTIVSTHIDKWTWRRTRINLIPVPFTKRMDGYGLYKTFGDRLLKELQQRDQATTGAFNTRPR